ncbi:hypothetical protein [Bombiscardovia coagulans]|uniref:Uncharacterized protein n=1 Tax=Bombiscardovia coagulans TaxID=686666 RepID=A0A261EW51_9BIFI|nr:hypothetical protein [Bombiscardovia coagulans]OZG51091.1 hypothetical protein BOCO_0006 [Bombiscardovia coagulans]
MDWISVLKVVTPNLTPMLVPLLTLLISLFQGKEEKPIKKLDNYVRLRKLLMEANYERSDAPIEAIDAVIKDQADKIKNEHSARSNRAVSMPDFLSGVFVLLVEWFISYWIVYGLRKIPESFPFFFRQLLWLSAIFGMFMVVIISVEVIMSSIYKQDDKNLL